MMLSSMARKVAGAATVARTREAPPGTVSGSLLRPAAAPAAPAADGAGSEVLHELRATDLAVRSVEGLPKAQAEDVWKWREYHGQAPIVSMIDLAAPPATGAKLDAVRAMTDPVARVATLAKWRATREFAKEIAAMSGQGPGGVTGGAGESSGSSGLVLASAAALVAAGLWWAYGRKPGRRRGARGRRLVGRYA